MTPTPDSDPDRRLSRRLTEWKVEDDLPPRFKEGVWRQLAREEEASATVPAWTLLLRRFSGFFARPQMAATTAAILILVGAGAGWFRAKADGARLDESLRVRYLQSVNPYQAPRS